MSTDQPGPSPSELVQIAVSLGGASQLLGEPGAAVAALGNALRVWQLAREVIQRGGGEDELTESKIIAEAARSDADNAKRYKWADEPICKKVFGKTDTAAGEAERIAPVTPDAIRHQLRDKFGQLGNAVFYWVEEHGIPVEGADRLKHWIAGAKNGAFDQEDYSPYNFAHQILGSESSENPALGFSAVEMALRVYRLRRAASE